MRVAQAFGVSGPLHETIGQWSHREFETRYEWLKEQWNEPDRTDHYLMQIAQRVIQAAAGRHAGKVTRESQKLGFEFVRQAPTKPVTVKEVSRRAKAQWKARLPGLKVVHKPKED